jgi:predicted naringenin-chalcone synthase
VRLVFEDVPVDRFGRAWGDGFAAAVPGAEQEAFYDFPEKFPFVPSHSVVMKDALPKRGNGFTTIGVGLFCSRFIGKNFQDMVEIKFRPETKSEVEQGEIPQHLKVAFGH